MYLLKTPLAIRELANRDRSLALKERAVLLLADGKKSDSELLTMVQCETALLHSLLGQGYLARLPVAGGSKEMPKPKAAPTVAAPAQAPPPPTNEAKAPVAADPFQGKRSLATTRMFLFDLTERLLTRRDPALANTLRERLREARDRGSMLQVAGDLLIHIEAHAGAARADEISARLAMLLPDEITT